MKWSLFLEKKTAIKLNPATAKRHLAEIAESASRNQEYGFVARVGKLKEPKTEPDEQTGEPWYIYRVVLRLEKPLVRSPEAALRQYEHVFKTVATFAGTKKWTLKDRIETPAAEPLSRESPQGPRPVFRVPDLTPSVFRGVFAGIYDREPQVRVIHDATTDYFETLARHQADPSVEVSRSHVLLKGKPAGCKSTLFHRLKKWYEGGSPVERVLKIDAHMMTKAGLEKFILTRAATGHLPEVIFLEEIEKQDPANLNSLLSVMAEGTITKLNALVGHQREVANILVWATCNDENIIRRFQAGALWSRFVHKVHCPRPNRQLMEKILLDKVTQVDGNPKWAEEAMKFAYETMEKVTGRPLEDPREIKGLLNGRDRLLDGSYQHDKLAILKAELEERPGDEND